jgi:hypothetical protein
MFITQSNKIYYYKKKKKKKDNIELVFPHARGLWNNNATR